MINKELKIAFQEYGSLEQLEAPDQELIKAAIEATASAYAPYSKFSVGAAVRLSGGTIVKGSNQENNAYPSGLCAERTAMFYASSAHPEKPIVAIAVAASHQGALLEKSVAPCGSCRQVMAEYQKKGGVKMNVILYGTKQILKFEGVENILPFIFDSI